MINLELTEEQLCHLAELCQADVWALNQMIVVEGREIPPYQPLKDKINCALDLASKIDSIHKAIHNNEVCANMRVQ